MPSISVTIPAKNDAAMLDRCLAALAAQKRLADEIIVVDNGSTDETVLVARTHGATVLTEPRPGITAAASRGYDACTGDVIARCDADSVVPRDWLAHIDETFTRRPDIVAATGSASFYDLSPVASWVAQRFYLEAYFIAAGAAIANTPLFGSNFAMRRELWQSVSPSVPRDKPDLHDDFDLSFRIAVDKKVLLDPKMRVAISGRPFRSAAAFGRQLTMAVVTLRVHTPQELPHLRWFRKVRAGISTRANSATDDFLTPMSRD